MFWASGLSRYLLSYLAKGIEEERLIGAQAPTPPTASMQSSSGTMRGRVIQAGLHELLDPDQQPATDRARTELVKQLRPNCRHQRVFFRVKPEKERGDELAELHPGDTTATPVSLVRNSTRLGAGGHLLDADARALPDGERVEGYLAQVFALGVQPSLWDERLRVRECRFIAMDRVVLHPNYSLSLRLAPRTEITRIL